MQRVFYGFLVGLILVARMMVGTLHSTVNSTREAGLSRALEAADQKAESSLTSWLWTQVQSRGVDAAFGNPPAMSATPLCTSGGICLYDGSSTFAITGNPGSSITTSTSGNDTSYNVERTSAFSNNVVSFQVNATVTMTVGGFTRSRCTTLTYRLKSAGNLAEEVGASDCGANVGVALEHDSGGCDPNNVGTCDPTGNTQVTPTSTEDHVTYLCKGCTGATPLPRPADNYVNGTWTNSNAASGWSSR